MSEEQLIATCPGPTGHIHQLQLRDGVYELVTFEPTHSRTLDEADAREWYKTTRRCGGKLHERFPVVRP